MTKEHPLNRAIKLFGSQQALAAKIGVHQSKISYWVASAKKGVPSEDCLSIEKATGGKVTALELLRAGPVPKDQEAANG